MHAVMTIQCYIAFVASLPKKKLNTLPSINYNAIGYLESRQIHRSVLETVNLSTYLPYH